MSMELGKQLTADSLQLTAWRMQGRRRRCFLGGIAVYRRCICSFCTDRNMSAVRHFW